MSDSGDAVYVRKTV
ncbi:MAG: hypothetical protein NWQ54_21155 [Paraglaciecola sp.]|nr:hypothetical protein [Paraglaciecola sp.]